MNPDQNGAKKTPAEEREERILAYWNEHKIFEKSVEREAPHGSFVFYDGPPFATGLPHFGHVLPTSIKDAVPRYKTMQGFRVRRRWGWDCHGLPVENLIEKELGLKSKKDIVNYGIKGFNAAASAAVHRYVADWKKIIPRLGRWADMENDYETMNSSYTESVWWAFKQLHDKGLVYEGFKPMQICPHCETTLSNFEVAQGYKDIKDISVYVKFELVDEPGTFLLAWTTTPWTLPGNVALAVGKDVEYVEVTPFSGAEAHPEADEKHLVLPKEKLIVSKDYFTRASHKFDSGPLMVFKGSDLVGRSYKPLFDYYSKDASLSGRENGWKVYAADFVTTTDGTGIVHIAPAFGADDYALGQRESLPFVQHVNIDGTFKSEVADFAGMKVKPKDTAEDKDAHLRTDIAVIQWLQNRGALFAKENLTHSYPHCWRCDTPLLNYAASSWFVRVSEFRDKLVAANDKVGWTPPEVGQGRFGNWLLNARDWAISRSRFWGAPIPVWRVVPSTEYQVPSKNKSNSVLGTRNSEPHSVVIGSVADLKKYSRAKNTYYIMRHGEAENNTLEVISSKADDPKHLTEKGRGQVKKAAAFFKGNGIDLIFVSPFMRTRETADILASELGFPKENIVVDDRLHEIDAGTYHGRPFAEFVRDFPNEKRFEIRLPGGENYADIRKRVGAFIYDAEKGYEGKNILIITHDAPAFILTSICLGLDDKGTISHRDHKLHFFDNAVPEKLDFAPLPHNEDYELDLHRPYIDDVELRLSSGERLARVEEVFDCWFESGSMPFGEAHYPFEKKGFDPAPGMLGHILGKSCGYPADFIAEGLDQTRGWFYSMLVLGVSLFGRSPYKNVVVNGIVLSEDGQKMSKSKSNFPDLLPVVNKYGADALRYYLLSSPLVRAQEFCFSEKGVDEVVKKHIGRLLNVVSFYELYGSEESNAPFGAKQEAKSKSEDSAAEQGSGDISQNILDQWIIARLNELNREVTDAMEKYELDKATRPFADFIDDLSTWYVRRSRDRFKSADGGDDPAEKAAALQTTRSVLIELSKLLAPFMPFLAEDLYLRMAGGLESVHLEKWPAAEKADRALLENMKAVREIASLGLEARSKAKINVRQPLGMLKVKNVPSVAIGGEKSKGGSAAFLDLIKEEVNVKEVVFDASISFKVELDTAITPLLKEEGELRDLMRAVQDRRKEQKLTIQDRPSLKIFVEGAVERAFLEKNKEELIKAVLLKDVKIESQKPLDEGKDGQDPESGSGSAGPRQKGFAFELVL